MHLKEHEDYALLYPGLHNPSISTSIKDILVKNILIE